MEERNQHGFGIHTRRIVAYVVLILVTIMCIFWFYVLFVNATRSNAELNRGFTLIPSKYAGKNIYSLFHNSNLPIVRGLLNSLFISLCVAGLSTYFSLYTAYHTCYCSSCSILLYEAVHGCKPSYGAYGICTY